MQILKEIFGTTITQSFWLISNVFIFLDSNSSPLNSDTKRATRVSAIVLIMAAVSRLSNCSNGQRIVKFKAPINLASPRSCKVDVDRRPFKSKLKQSYECDWCWASENLVRELKRIFAFVWREWEYTRAKSMWNGLTASDSAQCTFSALTQ